MLISVPYSPGTNGLRFSVEFVDDIWEYRNAGLGTDSHYVQNVNPTGKYYVPSYNDTMWKLDVFIPTLSTSLVFVLPRSAESIERDGLD